MALKNPNLATAVQKETFVSRFGEIVKNNDQLRDNYRVQFFDTASKSNYVINGLNGKSINVLGSLSPDELEKYKLLKSNWQG